MSICPAGTKFSEGSTEPDRRKILIVEDEILIAMDLQGRLENAGYDVPAIASSANAALDLAGSHVPDLILMDIRLRGGSDGIEAATSVRERMDIPVIFLTSHSDIETLERAKSSEPFGYVVKPFGSVNFRAIIEIAIQKHRTERLLRKSLSWHTAHEKARLMRLFHDFSVGTDSFAGEEAPVQPKEMIFEESFLEAIAEPCILLGQEGTIVLVSTRAEQLFGYSKDELCGKHIRILVPHSTDELAAMPTSLEPDSLAQGFECVCVAKNGNELPVEVSLGHIGAEGRTFALGLFRDIRGRKQVQTQREYVADLVESSHGAIFSQDLDGIIVSWNQGAERLYGYRASEIIGYPASVLLPSGSMHGASPISELCLDGWKQEETVQRGKDGRIVEVSQIISSIRDRTGSLIGLSTIAMDVSVHVRGEARFRGLLDASPDAVVVVDQDGRIVLANARVMSLFGYTEEELLAGSFEMLVPQHDRQASQGTQAEVFPQFHVRQVRDKPLLYGQHKDGREFPVEISLGPLDTKEGILVSTTIRDITERRLAEEKIERTLQEKDVMLNEIHHRVKNNLQVVSSLLNMQADQITDPAARRMFTDSESRIQSMALIHQQLYLASNFSEIDFASYLRTLANYLLASAAKDGSSFTVQFDADGTCLSLEDAIPCGLIVNELISNSLKHSFHGRLSGQIRIGFNSTEGVCVLTVDDDGIPLPSDLFADRPPTMGIRLVQALVAQLEGRVEIGGESKFKIQFSCHARFPSLP